MSREKPHYDWEVLHATTGRGPNAKPEVHEELQRAISMKRLVRYYMGPSFQSEPVEPHLYGRIDGAATLLCYVLGDGFEHEHERWRLVPLPDVTFLEVMQQEFPGKRPLPPEFDPDLQQKPPASDG